MAWCRAPTEAARPPGHSMGTAGETVVNSTATATALSKSRLAVAECLVNYEAAESLVCKACSGKLVTSPCGQDDSVDSATRLALLEGPLTPCPLRDRSDVGGGAAAELPAQLEVVSTSPVATISHRRGASCRVYVSSLCSALGPTTGHVHETLLMVIPAVLYAVQSTLVLHALQLNAGIGVAQWKPHATPSSSGGGSGNVAEASTGLLPIFGAAVIFTSPPVTFTSLFSVFVFSGVFVVDYKRLSWELERQAAVADMEEDGLYRLATHPYPLVVFMHTFCQGFTGFVSCLVLMQLFVGILLALAMKYSNNIMKTFPTSLALLISMAASVVVFGAMIQLHFVAGALMVLLSIFPYNIE